MTLTPELKRKIRAVMKKRSPEFLNELITKISDTKKKRNGHKFN